MLQNFPRKETHYIHHLQLDRELQTLERLPVELLEYVSDYLPIESVVAMHRSSKTLALKVPLGDNFCRKKLIEGKLHPHIWDFDIAEIQKQQNACAADISWDWRSVARLLAHKRFPIKDRDPRLGNLPDGLWNRGRIWNILEEALNQHYPASKARTYEKRTRRRLFNMDDIKAILHDLSHWWQ
jgi:hypothetical protein